MAVVIDANLLVTLVVRDDRRPIVSARFRAWSRAGEELHAPSLIRFEIASALTGILAAGHITDKQMSAAWTGVMATKVTLRELINGPAVIRIADRLGRRSAYDAAYVALATDLDAELWTLDGPLARNAGGAGMPVRLIEAAQP